MDPISSLSRVNLYYFVTGAAGSETVEVAFTSGAEPGPSDWHPAVWDSTELDGATARILVGPGGSGAVALADGTYKSWVRVTAPQETPVLPAGLVPVI